MTNTEMAVAIAHAEGVMMALYGFCRDMVIGCSVDEEKNGKLGDVVGDVMNGLVNVYDELEMFAQPGRDNMEHAIDKIVSAIVVHGQNDKQFKLGETIKYSPSDVGKILKEAVDNE